MEHGTNDKPIKLTGRVLDMQPAPGTAVAVIQAVPEEQAPPEDCIEITAAEKALMDCYESTQAKGLVLRTVRANSWHENDLNIIATGIRMAKAGIVSTGSNDEMRSILMQRLAVQVAQQQYMETPELGTLEQEARANANRRKKRLKKKQHKKKWNKRK